MPACTHGTVIVGENGYDKCAQCGKDMRHPGRPAMLTEETEKLILAAIGGGAFAWAAAAAAGVSSTAFHRWMADPRPEYQEFAEKVRKARARARIGAELRVYKERPLDWLRVGPGRDREGEPGWTDPGKVQVTGKVAHAHVHAVLPPIEPELDLTQLTDEELDELDRLTSKAQRKALPPPGDEPGGEDGEGST